MNKKELLKTKAADAHRTYSEDWILWLFKAMKPKINWSFQGAINRINRTGLVAKPLKAGITGGDVGNPAIVGYSGAVIVDDPLDLGNPNSKVALAEAVRFYDDKLATRRRTPTTPSIAIMQRIGNQDE